MALEPPYSRLPPEVIDSIFDLLPYQDLRQCNLTCKLFREHATDNLWKSVVLTDCSEEVTLPDDAKRCWNAQTPEQTNESRNMVGHDAHCDRKMIKILYILASKPEIASKVHVLTHRCHLFLPAIFSELPEMTFTSNTLSDDLRLLVLLRLAIDNMTNVRTLRIIFGHNLVTGVLLRGFLHSKRQWKTPIRRLWLESCNIDTALWDNFNLYSEGNDVLPVGYANWHSPPSLDLSHLESLRLRRLRVCEPPPADKVFAMSRGGTTRLNHNGRGGLYLTTINTQNQENLVDAKRLWIDTDSSTPLRTKASYWLNLGNFEETPEIEKFLRSSFPDEADFYRKLVDATYWDGTHKALEACTSSGDDTVTQQVGVGRYEDKPKTLSAIHIISQSSANLKSLNLDWLILRQRAGSRCGDYHQRHHAYALELLTDLSRLRFPHLRAFQFRNACAEQTMFPDFINLLHPSTDSERSPADDRVPDFVGFMEAHSLLKCLAWPMDHFFTDGPVSKEDQDRAMEIVQNLGSALVTLRIDVDYSFRGEPFTDSDSSPQGAMARRRRRRFISNFAPHMKALRELKLEGGVPKDETNQILMATRMCPLEKFVVIGLSSPIGNTWGTNGDDLANLEPIQYNGLLEGEDADAMNAAMELPLDPSIISRPFEATYGVHPRTPFLYQVANCFANTITEIKFCGYNGSPVLYTPTSITPALLCHLKHFPHLQKLTTSIWMMTYHEFDWREREVIDYWLSLQELETVAVDSVKDRRIRLYTESPEDSTSDVDMCDVVIDTMINDGELTVPLDTIESTNTMHSFQETGVGAAWPETFELDTVNPDLATAAEPPTVNAVDQPLQQMYDGDDIEPWLREKQHPRTICLQVCKLFGQHLSPIAKSRRSTMPGENGIRIKASFCLGAEQSDIFDFYVWVAERGMDGWNGPRQEELWRRWWDKLESRSWFEKIGV